MAVGARSGAGVVITVRLPEPLRDGHGSVMTMNATTLAEIIEQLGIEQERDELFNFAVNGELIVHGEKDVRLTSGDEVEIVVAFSGG
jgi:sulfur carrier protein ThiS